MTLRNDILNNLVDRITDIPVIKHRYVTREPMCDGMINALQAGESAVVVTEGEEFADTQNFSATTKSLQVTVELYYKTKKSEQDWKTRALSTKLNEMLADTIKIIMSDRQCAQNALNTYEVSNTIDVDGIYDNCVGLTVTIEIQYRHKPDDPTVKL